MAALTGRLLGEALTHPMVLTFAAAIMVALALSMFGMWEIKLPARLTTWGGKSRSGYGGTLFMGLLVGLLAAPCVGPFLVALMVHVGQKQSVFYGFATFFALAVGMGLPLAALAVVSGTLERIPGAGAWTLWVRRVFGCILLIMAAYVAQPLMSDALYRWVTLIIGLASGVWLSVFYRTEVKWRLFKVLKYAVGALAVAAAVVFFWTSRPEAVKGPAWQPYTPVALPVGKILAKPAMVYFTADWCLPCRIMAQRTFPLPDVITSSRRFLAIKVDLTQSKNLSAPVRALLRRYGVKGPPTILFIDKSQAEVSRIIGFTKPDKLLRHMSAAQRKK